MCQKLDRLSRIIIQTGNGLLEQVEHFKYLGSSTDQVCRCVMEIRFRIAHSKSA
jgi:hypothetical protein